MIGHELTHGFDDQGRKIDAAGALRDWWAPEDGQKFEALTARLGQQYSAMELLPGSRVNGALTMGENVSDLGGVSIALDAYHASLGGRSAPIINGLTGDQRFMIGWAKTWRGKLRETALRRQLLNDFHAPYIARVNGVLRNLPDWYIAFDVGPGDALFLDEATRVRIW
jgi:putative endopeptidase